MENAKKKV